MSVRSHWAAPSAGAEACASALALTLPDKATAAAVENTASRRDTSNILAIPLVFGDRVARTAVRCQRAFDKRMFAACERRWGAPICTYAAPLGHCRTAGGLARCGGAGAVCRPAPHFLGHDRPPTW